MEGGQVTTPFGRRPVTLALVKRQIATTKIKDGASADKWKVFRDASEAREVLGLQDRSLAVLDALLSFYPENELRQDASSWCFRLIFNCRSGLTVSRAQPCDVIWHSWWMQD